MANAADLADIETGVIVLNLRKGGKTMSAVSLLKRKLRGYPVGSLSVRVTGV
jgi:hypothetical protein